MLTQLTKSLVSAVLISLVISYTNFVYAEGTKQVSPNSTEIASLFYSPSDYGSYFNCPDENRIKFKINDHTVENLYFGFRWQSRGSSSVITNMFYRIRNSAGTVVVAETALGSTTGSNGLITSYNQAVAGPNIGGTNTAGYRPITFDPSSNDEFFIEIYRGSGGSVSTAAIAPFWDLTVGRSNGTTFDGRVFAGKWGLIAGQPTGNYNGAVTDDVSPAFYAYTKDSSVVKVQFTDFNPLAFNVAFNSYGVSSAQTNWEIGRKSIYSAVSPSLPNGYKTFLNIPDISAYPTPTPPLPPIINGKVYGCPGAFYIPYKTFGSGDVKILLDLNGVPGYQESTADRYLNGYDIPAGNNVMPWDGKNGLGNTLAAGQALNFQFIQFKGRTNMPLYDPEWNLNGFSISSVRPSVQTNVTMYWDDSALPVTTGQAAALNNTTGPGINNSNVGQSSPGHAWNGNYGSSLITIFPAASNASTGNGSPSNNDDDFGNVRIINTWFWPFTTSSSNFSTELPGCDNDKDGILDDVDIDDDNDGIPDTQETNDGSNPTGDLDNDGIPNYLDPQYPGFVDVNNDGLNDNFDPDGDGIPVQFDLDNDNDGIPDIVEAGGVDTNGDGKVDSTIDSDNDGLIDLYDTSTGGDAISNLDSDGDGIPNFKDLDSDNDGLSDIAEVGGVDVNGDGRIDSFNDVDKDGLDDTVDGDVGNDGSAENTANALLVTGADTDSDGIPNSYPNANADGDSKPNPYDLDADNDGIPDTVETGGVDVNGDGKLDGFVDADKDGFNDIVDGDVGNDGTAENTANSLMPTGPDANNDGKADSFPNGSTDNDGIPNYLDLDSDNDGIQDVLEVGGSDTNNDGRIDSFIDTDNDGFSDNVDGDVGNDGTAENTANALLKTGADINSDGKADSYPFKNPDGGTLGLGKPNPYDLDSDDDGIIDSIEAGGSDPDKNGIIGTGTTIVDTDGDGWSNIVDNSNGGTPLPIGDKDLDGKPNYLDLDSDNDGVLDNWESLFYTNSDPDNDGKLGTGPLADADGDGLGDAMDPDTPTGATNSVNSNYYGDRDGDGIPNQLDIDADNDGIVDNIEGQSTNGYQAPTGIDTDNDGIDNAYDITNGGTPGGFVNTDGGSAPDYVDTDADNDGIRDLAENHLGTSGSFDPSEIDANSDGVLDFASFTDSDGDGLADIFDLVNGISTSNNVNNNQTPTNQPNTQESTTPERDWREVPDSDGDGVNDLIDVDDDNDGILDTIEGFGDTDNDGIPNYLDLDSDNDGITDVIEAGGSDPDGDGFPGTYPGTGIRPPVNSNGQPSDVPAGTGLSPGDFDGDGIPDYIDLDSDNDGIADVIEAGGVDPDGDGKYGSGQANDADADGLPDAIDPFNNITQLPTGNTALPTGDFDGDGNKNYLDRDSDNDGISDVIEAGGTDPDNDGVIGTGPITDTDGDGWSNIADKDNGGVQLPVPNSDGQGNPNYLDLDSDNDGITDVIEAGGSDPDNNGQIGTGTGAAIVDADNDGLADLVDGVGLPITNTDGDTKPNYIDIDADNDGIVDNIEAQSTTGYISFAATDTDGDGLVDAYDPLPSFGGAGLSPVNKDGLDNPDYLDLDTDNDGKVDRIEGWDTNGNGIIDGSEIAYVGTTDTDGDGLLDEYDTISGINTANNVNNNTTPSSYPDMGNTISSERDWRELPDSDKDGISDNIDIDDDNDGILDTVEGGGYDPNADADSDGIPNYLDTTPGPGLPAFVDSNSDGINDFYDADKDGIINSLDLDSDNDGIPDLVEAGGIDSDGDGKVDITTDSDNDGLFDVYDSNNGGNAISNLDTDGDGIPNYLDLDSDNDGIQDVLEAGGIDANNDGKIDGFIDIDNDGFSDTVDGDVGNDGTPENTSNALILTSSTGTNGIPNSYTKANADGTGLPNPYDLDADGDGILDTREANVPDSDNNGIADGAPSGGSDPNGWTNGIDGNSGGTALVISNNDGDSKPNYLDIDADNDGIVDNIEGQSTAGYFAPTGIDTDGDGIDNAYDNQNTFGGDADNGITPNNMDGSDNPDYIDVDTDNDGIDDVIEGWDTNGNGVIDGAEIELTSTIDTDNDGLFDSFDTINGITNPNNVTNNTTPSSYPDQNVGGNRDWREVSPVANDDTNTSIPSTAGATAINGLTATDTDGTIASYTIKTLPTGGTLSLNGTPVTIDQVLTPAEAALLTYDPSGSFTGNDTFTFTATDNSGAVDATPATITIPVGNNPPVANDDTNTSIPSTAGATAINGLTATDTDGTIASYTIKTLPTGGTLSLNGTPVTVDQVLTPAEAALLTYDPSGSFTGNDTFTFTATDNSGAVDATPATVTIPVGNNPPVANDDTNTSIPSTAGATAINGLTATDTDGTIASYTIKTLPTGGTLSLNGTPVTVDQVLTPAEAALLTYDPSGSFTGNDTFTFTATDNSGAVDATPATVTIPVGNNPPVANDDTNTSIPSTAGATAINGLTATDTDGTIASYTIKTLPTGGTLSLNGTPVTVDQVLTPAEAALLTYDPSGSFTGNATFTFTATDNSGAVDATPATVTIPVGNNPPVANDDTNTSIPSTAGATAINGLTATDTDGTIASYTIKTLPTGGTLSLNGTPVVVDQVLTPAEAALLTYDPSGSFTGNDTFTFTATDNSGAVDATPATVTIPVGNNPPVANDDTNTSIPSTAGATAINGLTATDTDGTIASYTIKTLPTGGTLSLNGTPVTVDQVLTPAEAALLTYDPSGSFTGNDTFTFTATDNSGAVDATPATVTIPVGNNPPVANDDTNTSIPSTAGATAINGLTATDTDGTIASYTIKTLPTGGTLSLNGTPVVVDQVLTPAEAALLTYDPSGSFTGIDTFTFTATDNSGAVDATPATVTIPVGNNPPVANNDSNPIVNGGGAQAIKALTATDTDGTIASYSIKSLPPLGVLALNGTPVTINQVLTPAEVSQLTYNPGGSFLTTDSFTFTAIDNSGIEDATPATIILDGIPPLTNSDTYGYTVGVPRTVPPLENDVNGDAVDATTVEIIGADLGSNGKQLTVAGEGVWTVDPITGAFTFTPLPSFLGIPSSVPYRVRDNQGTYSNVSNVVLVSSALFVDLTAFNVIEYTNGNMVSWKAKNEIGFDYFSLRRSRNLTEFSEIGKIKGNNRNGNYSFLDEEFVEGITYYQLKMVNTDGTHSLSQIISIKNEDRFGTKVVYPNPSPNRIFKLNSSTIYNKIVLKASNGMIHNVEFNQHEGIYEIKVSDNLPSGIYFLEFVNDKSKFTFKVVLN